MKSIHSFLSRFFSGALAKGGIAIFVGTMGSNVAAYLYHLIVGRILGPVGYGEIAALLSLTYILNVPVAVVQTVLIKYISILKARSATGELKQLFILSSKYLGIAIILGLFLISLISGIIADFLHISSTVDIFWIYMAFGVGFMSVVPVSMMLGYQMFGVYSVYLAVGSYLRLAFGALFAPFGVTMTLIGAVIYLVPMYISELWPIRNILRTKVTALSIPKRDLVSYSIPTFLALLGITMLTQQDVILIKHFFSAHDAGIYSAISTLGKIIFFASSSIGLVIFPIISERVEQKKSYQSIVVFALGIVGFCCAMLTTIYFVFPIQITELLYGKQYIDAAGYLGIFGLFISFFSLANLLMNICLASGRTKVWCITLFGAIVQMVLLGMYHQTLWQASIVNLSVAMGLFVSLLVYYRYAK